MDVSAASFKLLNYILCNVFIGIIIIVIVIVLIDSINLKNKHKQHLI